MFGAFSLRASITGAGRESAGDPEAARRASRKKEAGRHRMKVRWTQNSVRLRITPTELHAIVNGETVREELRLPGGAPGPRRSSRRGRDGSAAPAAVTSRWRCPAPTPRGWPRRTPRASTSSSPANRPCAT